METDQIVAKGQEAQRLMENPVLIEALETIRRKQTTVFATSAPGDRDKRETAYYTLKAIEELELQLSKFKSDGVFEAEKAKRAVRKS